MLHLTKVAFGAASLDQMLAWWSGRGDQVRLTTRYRPKRADELVGGSLYWILKHQLVARSEIIGFEDTAEGRTDIVVANRLIRVRPMARRAHQGWRYLEAANAPADFEGGDGTDELPSALMGELTNLGLL